MYGPAYMRNIRMLISAAWNIQTVTPSIRWSSPPAAHWLNTVRNPLLKKSNSTCCFRGDQNMQWRLTVGGRAGCAVAAGRRERPWVGRGCGGCRIDGGTRSAGAAPGDADGRPAQDLTLFNHSCNRQACPQSSTSHLQHPLFYQDSSLKHTRKVYMKWVFGGSDSVKVSVVIWHGMHQPTPRANIAWQSGISNLGPQLWQCACHANRIAPHRIVTQCRLQKGKGCSAPASAPWRTQRRAAARTARSRSPCRAGSWYTRCLQSGRIARADRPRRLPMRARRWRAWCCSGRSPTGAAATPPAPGHPARANENFRNQNSDTVLVAWLMCAT